MESRSKKPNSERLGHIVRPVFLLLEKNTLIAADMIGTLEDEGPCRIIHVTSPKHISGAMRGVPQLDVAFLELRVDRLAHSNLVTELNRRGAHIVLTRGETDQEKARAAGWGMLIRPFTDQMLRDALADARRRPTLLDRPPHQQTG